MAQLRQKHEEFMARETAVVVVGSEDEETFRRYFTKHKLPFIGLPDPKHTVLKLYGQQVKLFRLGRMPTQVLVDKEGFVRFAHYGSSMQDIPDVDEVLAVIDQLGDQ